MRLKLLQEAASVAAIPASEMCGECTSPERKQLFDELMRQTGQTHVTLHMIERRAPSMTAFQRAIDSHLLQVGKPVIDWRKPIPVARHVSPEPSDSTAATIPAPPPESN